MSEVRLVIREAARDWSGTIHGSSADRAIAALCADPVTLEELEAAYARFEKPRPNRRSLSNLSPGLCDEPYDAGLVVIDLVARLVYVESTYSSPGSTGEITYHDGHCATNTRLRYHLADDWLFTRRDWGWRGTADKRRHELAARPVVDARKVIYGRPLLEFIARKTFAAFARRDDIESETRARWLENARQRLARVDKVSPDDVDPLRLTEEEITPYAYAGEEETASPFYDALRQIHASWLMTPRDDLAGKCPRDVALERRSHLTWDIQDQCGWWSALGHCPPGIDPTSYAFRNAGFGTHELVLCYGLIRKLLWSCWERLVELNKGNLISNRPESLAVGDFLTSEVSRLETVRDEWFDTPERDCHGRTPHSVIDRERARLPEGMSGHDAIIDPDCPCCQMMADMPGPAFWGLDGSNMDDEFAFDIDHPTREEWDDDQRRSEEFNKRFNAEQEERKRLGVTQSYSDDQADNSVWTSRFSIADSADLPLGVRLFGIGCHLAELIVDIRSDAEFSPSEAQQLIDQLNLSFGNLREVLQTSEPSLAVALIDPVIDKFTESLAAVGSVRSDLSEQCESLQDSLTQFLDPAPPKPTWDSDDMDVPF